MDDVLSAIDGKTEALVVERLLGKSGLFRKLGSTVILASHTGKTLSQTSSYVTTNNTPVKHLPLADNILILGADGSIIEQGTFEDLRTRNSDSIKSIINQEQSQLPQTADPSYQEEVLENEASAPVKPKPTTESETTDLTRQIGDMSVYGYYLKSIGWRIALVNVVTALVWTLGSNFPRKSGSCSWDSSLIDLQLFG